MIDPFQTTGAWVMGIAETLGQMLSLLAETVSHCRRAFSARERIFEQAARVGYDSLLMASAIISIAASAAAAGRNNRRWFLVSILAVLLFLVLLGLRFQSWN